jgi:hypothetical protein
VGFLLQSFIGGATDLFKVSPLSDRVFRFSLSCKDVGFTVYQLRSYACSTFKAYLHLWNSGSPNWIKEWQRFSEEESKSWKLVSYRRSSPVSFADVVRKPALSGANLVPLGRPDRPKRSSSSLRQRYSVFDRISFPSRPAIDQGFAGRSQFQKYSNSSNGRVASPGLRPSLRASRVHPWAPRKLIWRPKKILEQCPGNFGQDFVPSINGSAGPAAKGYCHIWDHSFSGKNLQIFGFSGQKCKRSFGSFPNKFENASWVYPPRLWFRSPCSRLRVGLLPRPFIIILVSSLRWFSRVAALHLPRNLHCSQNPIPPRCRGRVRQLQALRGTWCFRRLRDLLLSKPLKKWHFIELILHRSSPMALWRSRSIIEKSWYVL